MNARLLVWVGVTGLMLGACGGDPSPTTRIVAFTSSVARVPRGEPITLTWQAADAGVQDGLFSCVLTRRYGDEPAETTLQATCTGNVIDVPAAPVTAATVHYRLEVLKQPYDVDDPYVARELTVTLDTAHFAVRAGGTGSDQVTGVSTLADGGAIVTGDFAGAATFGTTTLTSAGGVDAYVARLHPDGTWAWAHRVGDTGSDAGRGVSALADGGALVTGSFAGTATFGTTSLASAESLDVFVARIDPDGTWAWAARAGGTTFDVPTGISAHVDAGAIVAGVFLGTATFGATTLTSAGSEDAFVARIDPDGTWVWAIRVGDTDFEQASAVVALPDGGAIVAGSFAGTATFGSTTLTGAGGNDAFVARIDSDGTWVWAARAGGTEFDDAWGVAALPDGGAIVAGSFYGTANFGTSTLTASGNRDGFVARIDADGSWAWAARGGGADYDAAASVTTHADGGAIVTGYFSETATFGSTTLTVAGAGDAFVARIDPEGVWTWATRAGGTEGDGAGAVSALADGGAIVAGSFGAAATFGTTTLTSAGSSDAFVARIGADGTW